MADLVELLDLGERGDEVVHLAPRGVRVGRVEQLDLQGMMGRVRPRDGGKGEAAESSSSTREKAAEGGRRWWEAREGGRRCERVTEGESTAFEPAEPCGWRTCSLSWLNHCCSCSSLETRESGLAPVKASDISLRRSTTCAFDAAHMLSLASSSAV